MKLQNKGKKKLIERLGLVILIALIVSFKTGCASAPKILVIPANEKVELAKAGTSRTFTNDTYLVPPELMRKILHKFAEDGKSN